MRCPVGTASPALMRRRRLEVGVSPLEACLFGGGIGGLGEAGGGVS